MLATCGITDMAEAGYMHRDVSPDIVIFDPSMQSFEFIDYSTVKHTEKVESGSLASAKRSVEKLTSEPFSCQYYFQVYMELAIIIRSNKPPGRGR